MAEDSDLEKSESASPRRLEQAREEGQVPHSRELATFISLMVGVVALYVLGRWGGHRLMGIMKTGLSLPRSLAFEPGAMGRMLENLAGDALLTVAPLLIATVVAALVTPFPVGGWVFTTKVLRFDHTRLDPLQGLGRMFSTHGLVELVKATLKAVLVAVVGVDGMGNRRHFSARHGDAPLYAFGDFFRFAALFVAHTDRNGLIRRICENAFLRDLGKYSYGLYVFHLMFEYVWHKGFGDRLLLSGIHPALGQLIYIVLAFFATYLLARLSWVLIESPFLRLKEVWAKRKREA